MIVLVKILTSTGSVKSPDILRDQLKMATRSKNKQALEKAIIESEASGYKELDSDLQKAIKVFESLGGVHPGRCSLQSTHLPYFKTLSTKNP